MEYRKMKNGKDASLLGFGCMRFPVTKDGKIDEAEAEMMLKKAYESGVTYFDTAYVYHGGDSETFLGKVMKQFDRSTFTLATKLPTWEVKSLDDARRLFKEQCDKLQTEYIDYYLLHALNRNSFREMRDLGVIELFDEYKEKGLIKNYGFSFHDDFDTFKEIIEYREWDFCQIQYNYMDKDTQATTKGYALSKELNVPLVIMEPIKGGNLAKLPDEAKEVLANHRDMSPAAWALSWVGSHDNVKVILSGMSTMDQVDDNLNTFNNFKELSSDEMEAIEEVGRIIQKKVMNGCTGCRYCMPCPAGVNIPRNFSIWNEFHKYDNVGGLKWDLSQLPKAELPTNCVKCGKCEKACPQKLSIRDDLAAFAKEIEQYM